MFGLRKWQLFDCLYDFIVFMPHLWSVRDIPLHRFLRKHPLYNIKCANHCTYMSGWVIYMLGFMTFKWVLGFQTYVHMPKTSVDLLSSECKYAWIVLTVSVYSSCYIWISWLLPAGTHTR